MRTDIIRMELQQDNFMVQPDALDSFMKYLNDGMPNMATSANMETITKIANNSVMYEKVQNVAVISIDGAMYKKDMSGMCMSVASYQHILKYAEVAEQDVEVSKILYRVTTVGGTAAGINPVEDAVSNSKKETAVIYEDVGASAGIYAFCGADKRYATKGTEVGSIGVVAGFKKPKKDEEISYQTSRRAGNKVLDLNTQAGRDKFQIKLDKLEEDFYAVVEKNTGFTATQIEETFNSGDTIFAEEAVESGFLHGVTTFKELLNSMVEDKELTSGVNHASAQINTKTQTQGEQMSDKTFDKASFEALEASHAEALKGVNTQLGVATAATATAEAALKTVTVAEATAVGALATLQATVDAKVEATPEIMAMAFKNGVGEKTLIAMASANTLDDAKLAMVDGMDSDGAFGASKDGFSVDAKKQAEDELTARCDTLAVTFVGEK